MIVAPRRAFRCVSISVSVRDNGSSVSCFATVISGNRLKPTAKAALKKCAYFKGGDFLLYLLIGSANEMEWSRARFVPQA
ncbi:hypothetical protein D3C84_693770 [compost metagenome]